MTSPLIQLQELGQSPWHDNIRRGQLASGELARMVADGDITGLTSNPSIFEKAISSSSDYDLTPSGLPISAIYSAALEFGIPQDQIWQLRHRTASLR